MLNSWIADAVGKAFANNISHKEIAAKAGYNPRYLSAILNQKRNPANAETRIMTAISDIIRERKSKNNA